MRHAYGNADGDSHADTYAHANINANSHADTYTHANINANIYIYSDSDGDGCGHSYSYGYRCLAHTDMCARQSIHDSADRRQHRAGHDGYRQSWG